MPAPRPVFHLPGSITPLAPSPLLLRPRLTLLAPAAAALLPFALARMLVPRPVPALAAGYTYAALGLVALLGWRFQRSRLVAAAAALALALQVAPAWEPAAVVVLAPLFAVLALGADRRLAAPRGWLQLALAPAAAGIAAWLAAHHAELSRSLLAGVGWATPPIVAAGVGLAVLLLVTLRRGRALEAGLLAAAGAATAGLYADSPAREAWMLGAALALAVAVVEAAYALAFRDELTDLPGRRALASLLGSLRPPYAIAIVDVDHFKRFNDRYGHDVGDQVLRMVAARLARVGGGGRAFRSGGEEFTLVFPGCTREEATPHLEALRRAVADAPFVPRRALRPPKAKGVARRGSGGGRGLKVTISVGVAAGGARSTSPEQVVKSADKAMYRAKQSGRNRVVA